MSDVPLDEVIHFDCITHNATTGAVSDADSTPTFAVYEESTDTDIGVGGNLTKRTSLTGNYRGSFTASAANGFELGKFYNVIASATVNSVAGKAVVKSFRIVAAETTVGFKDVAPDWGKVRNPTTSVDLSGTTIATTQQVNAIKLGGVTVTATTSITFPAACTVATTTGAVGSVTGAVGSVTTVSTGAITSGSFAASAINAAAIAADAITDAKVASDVTIASVTGAVGSVTGAVGSVVGLTVANLDVAVSTRMATYTQPTGFLAATFPATIASTTNITAATGVVLSGVTHTGAVIPTVSAVTGLTAANLDVAVSTRLASASYTSPPSAVAISSQVASDLDVLHGSGSWQTATGFSTLSQADVRTAVGLSAANLDSQIGDLPTNAELATALAGADDAVLAAIGAEAVKTTAIQTSIDDLENLSASEVNAEILDVLNVDTFGELSSPPAATSSILDKLTWLFMWVRNKSTETGTERKLFADDATTVVSTESVSDDGTTFTKGEAS